MCGIPRGRHQFLLMNPEFTALMIADKQVRNHSKRLLDRLLIRQDRCSNSPLLGNNTAQGCTLVPSGYGMKDKSTGNGRLIGTSKKRLGSGQITFIPSDARKVAA